MNKLKKYLLFIPALVLITLAFCFKTDKKNNNELTPIIVEILESYHYEPKDVNDDFSRKIFKLYFERLDFSRRFFIQSDIDSLTSFQTKLDNEAKEGTFAFFNEVNKKHINRINLIEKYYSEILDQKMDFNMDENLVYDEDKSEFLKSTDELKEFWRKSLKKQVLEKLYAKNEQQENLKKDSSFKIKPFDTLEKNARIEVKKTMSEWIKRLKKIDDRDRMNIYVNCITEIFDPHTNYFPPQQKEQFDIQMRGKLEGIGASLQEKDGYIKIMSIVPGSPSYKSGELKTGDLIIKVAQGNAEPVDVTSMKLDDAIQLIRGKKGTEVRLTVKKPDESIKIISLIRDVIVIEEGSARSFIIEHDNQKIGFIHLPDFYGDMQDRNGRYSAKDVKEEIEKLKKDNVTSIIFDLRNNGGGLLNSAIDIGGYFIEKGPITGVKSKGEKVKYLEDNDASVLFEGPLVILINENSASASEIFAAAMQDYGRAIIVGSGSFGKGTVQQFIDLDQAKFLNSDSKLGSLKLTIQKFYRINGGTTQLVGVKPDVNLPERYKYLEYGERESDFPLGYDVVEKAKYKTKLDFSKCINKATSNSKDRVFKDEVFNQIENYALRVKEQNIKTTFTLNYEKFKAEQTKQKADNKKLENILKDVKPLKIVNTNLDINKLSTDTLKLKIKNDWNNSYQKDIYIKEAVKIIKDLK